MPGRYLANWTTPTRRDWAKIAWNACDTLISGRPDQPREDPFRSGYVREELTFCMMCGFGFNISSEHLTYWNRWAEACLLPKPAWVCSGGCEINWCAVPNRPVDAERKRIWETAGILDLGFCLTPNGFTLNDHVQGRLWMKYLREDPICHWDPIYRRYFWWRSQSSVEFPFPTQEVGERQRQGRRQAQRHAAQERVAA